MTRDCDGTWSGALILCIVQPPLSISLQGAQSVAVDAMLAARTSVTHSSAMVDEFNDLAGQVLGALRGQRGVLKGAHRKVLDVATTLGMSNSLMRMIERRSTGDKILVYGGMLVIVSMIVLVWYWRSRA